uniref:IniB N-terminal domain-containing protein n=1 Tax=Microbacterium sp. CPCC 204701 TaxID=2493084 RepID=UPI000FDC694D
MSTPLATIANSIIEFILSLLRDPAAMAALKDDPEGTLSRNRMEGLCADDVRAVAPVIYDRPDVVPKAHHTPPPPSDNDVVNEISRITSHWTWVDSRSTIVDQSVNQNIWTEGGDVTQVFDQSAGVASGDGSVASGDDILAGTPGDTPPDETPDEGIPGLPDLPDLPGLGDDTDPDVVAGEPGQADEAPSAVEDTPAPTDQLDTGAPAVPPPVEDVIADAEAQASDPAAAP